MHTVVNARGSDHVQHIRLKYQIGVLSKLDLPSAGIRGL